MAAPKPLAALSSALLARKGMARPAMRPQAFAGATSPSLEDLGWNDMGPEPESEPVPEPEAPVPPVLIEREALAQRIEVPEPVRAVSVATAQRLRRETDRKGRAAFTLRLDPERHLRLRLAGAISHRSAQTLVTLALDALIQSMPTVEALVEQLPPATHSKR